MAARSLELDVHHVRSIPPHSSIKILTAVDFSQRHTGNSV